MHGLEFEHLKDIDVLKLFWQRKALTYGLMKIELNLIRMHYLLLFLKQFVCIMFHFFSLFDFHNDFNYHF